MKKLVLALILAVAMSANAFAEHPDGWGIGIVGRGDWTVHSGGWGNRGISSMALSLKVQNIPIYWGFNVSMGNNHFGVGVTGDYHLIHDNIIDFNGPKLGCYLGVGGYFGLSFWYPPETWNYYSLSIGARLPIGLSFQVPIYDNISLEIFGALVPNLGLGFWFWESGWDTNRSRVGISGGIGGELGIRIWF